LTIHYSVLLSHIYMYYPATGTGQSRDRCKGENISMYCEFDA